MIPSWMTIRMTIWSMILLLGTVPVHGQTFDEWFRQKKTQTRYLIEQLVALKAYDRCLEKGYTVALKGLNAIRDTKKGDLDTHRNYFMSLRAVNPVVAHYSRTGDIVKIQAGISDISSSLRRWLSYTPGLNGGARREVRMVLDGLDRECAATIEELKRVAGGRDLQMTDKERLRRLDRLYEKSLGQYNCVSGISNQLILFIRMKQASARDITHMQNFHGIYKNGL